MSVPANEMPRTKCVGKRERRGVRHGAIKPSGSRDETVAIRRSPSEHQRAFCELCEARCPSENQIYERVES
jgi:hypothetical protein